MSSREEVLGRIRAALAGPPGTPPAPGVDVPRHYRTAGEHTPGSPALLELLTDRLLDYKATVLAGVAADVPSVVARALAERGLRRVVAPAGVPAEWLGAAEALRDDPPLAVDALDEADAVVTGCAVAVAETGTIVLDGGAESGRRALTLVPDHHVCVVRADQIVSSVPEAFERLQPSGPITFVSGPSATSDIELERVEGVHGPRRLDVVVV